MRITVDSPAPLPGVEKAAHLLLGLARDSAAKVLRELSPKDAIRLVQAMSNLRPLRRMEFERLLCSFLQEARECTELPVRTDHRLRELLGDVLGERQAAVMLQRFVGDQAAPQSLCWLDSATIVGFLEGEHPQFQAFVIACLDPESAAQVLRRLPETLRASILLRVAALRGASPLAHGELDRLVRQYTEKRAGLLAADQSGSGRVAAILRALGGELEDDLLEAISGQDPALGAQLGDDLFQFDDLATLDDRDLKTLLRALASELIVQALGRSPRALRSRMLRCSGLFRRRQLRRALVLQGAPADEVVEGAQREVLAVARRLAEAGEINFAHIAAGCLQDPGGRHHAKAAIPAGNR